MTSIKLPKLTFWRVVFLALLALGFYSTVVRFTQGLGASTNLSDQFPWGIWIGFDILCGVALAAGGFTISAVVYIFNIEKFKPIIRPTMLTAFLGYLLVVFALMFDLGFPYRVWHPLVMWNPRSVMFEVGWCVTLYTTVLALEFSPIVFERFKLMRLYKIAKAATIPLVIMGVILSTLHQSSLGSLYLIVPHKLHPLWYSPMLPIFFYVSAIALGCAMTIFESFLSLRAFRKSIELDLLTKLGKAIIVVLSIYFLLKLQDLSSRGALGLAFQSSYEGRMFLAEMLLGVIAPIVLLLVPRIRANQHGLFISALMVVLGFVMNRLNVSMTGMDRSSGASYFPGWTELSVTAMIVAIGFLVFSLAVKYLPVFSHEEELTAHAQKPELPAPAALRQPLISATMLALALGGSFMLGALALSYSGIRLRGAIVSAATMETSPIASDDVLRQPDVVFPMSAKSAGPVTFRHSTHGDLNNRNCAVCHSGQFNGVSTKLKSTTRPDMHGQQFCGSCHDGEKAFAINKGCLKCHAVR